MASEKEKQPPVEGNISHEATKLLSKHSHGKIAEYFVSPKRRGRNFDSCPTTPSKNPRHLLKRIGKSVSESSEGLAGDPLEPSQWVKDAKNGVAAASTLEELKQHLYVLLDKVNILESELKFVQAERQILQKDLKSVKKQKHFPFKSLSGLLNRSGSTTSTTTVNSVESTASPSKIDLETADVYLGGERSHRRRSSSEITVNPRVTSLNTEESSKPRRKSTSRIAKFDRTKSALLGDKLHFGRKCTSGHLDDTKGIELEEKTPSSSGSSRRRNCSTSILDKAKSSCLTMRNSNNGDNGDRRNESSANGDGNDDPTLDEIRTWARSFDTLMSTARGRRKFLEFLRSEYSDENLLFWLACEELHKEVNPSRVEEKARLIYEDYISILSPKEVSLDSRTREVVNKNMTEPSPTTFDEAQEQIYLLMHRDSFPRFVNSKMFRNLLEKASQEQ